MSSQLSILSGPDQHVIFLIYNVISVVYLIWTKSACDPSYLQYHLSYLLSLYYLPYVTYRPATWLQNPPPAFRYALAVPTLPERIPQPAGCRDPFGRTYAFIMLRNTIPPRSVTGSSSVLLWTTPHVIFMPIHVCDILPYDFHSLSLRTCSIWNT